MPEPIDVLLIQGEHAGLLDHVTPGVFDNQVAPRWAREFLQDPRHHLAVAVDQGTVVGMASAVHHVHPDKPPELWINEIGVAETYRRRGLGRRLLQVLLSHGKALRCRSAWVLAETGNDPAIALYEGAGGLRSSPEPIMFEFGLDPE